MMRQLAKQTSTNGSKVAKQVPTQQLLQNIVHNGHSQVLSSHFAHKYYSTNNTSVNTIKDGNSAILPPYPHFPIPRVSQNKDTAKELVEWIKNYNGFVNDQLHVGCIQQYKFPNASDDGNWGLIAKNHIPKDTILATVPVPLCLFPLERPSILSETVKKDIMDQNDGFYQGVAGIVSAVNMSFWELRLGIRLLAERAAETSFFSPYINALPSNFPTHPLFYSRDAVNALQYLPIQKDLSLRSRTIHTLAKHMTLPSPDTPFNQIPPFAKLTIGTFNGFQPSAADLAWATVAVSSRAFQSPLTPPSTGATKADTKCLVPLIDMCNHSFNPNCKTSFMATTDVSTPNKYQYYHVVLRALTDIQPGTELSLNYFQPSTLNLNEVDDVATLVSQLTFDITTGKSGSDNSIRNFFKTHLTTAPEFSEDGFASNVTNDELLLSYGFTPLFNAHDSIVLTDSIALFTTALEMAHDITISPENEFNEDPMNASTPEVSEDEAELDENGLPKLREEDIITDADRIIADARKNKGKLMKPTINVVLPTSLDQNTLQKDLIDDIPSLGVPLGLSYRGPNDALLAFLRVMTMGARIPGEGNVDEIRDRDLQLAETRTRTKLQDMGDEKAFERDLHPSEWLLGLGADEPISEANEKAAMALLYHMLVMAAASFPHKLHNDAQLLSTAIRKRQEDEYAAIKFSRTKKQLISHTMKLLATHLDLDDEIHKWHFMLD